MCVFSMVLKYGNLYSKSKMSLNRAREIAYERRQYVHYLVYYVKAKLLRGEVTAYVLYCSL